MTRPKRGFGLDELAQLAPDDADVVVRLGAGRIARHSAA